MSTKTCIITGANSGIGKITAIELAKKGYQILMLVRNSEKSEIAFEDIKRESKSDLIKMFFVDFSSVESIKNVVLDIQKQYSKIDLLINNAGVFKRKEETTVDGFELSIAVNYIAVFLLTNSLLPQIKKAKNARVINISSELYKRGKVFLENGFSAKKFSGDLAYANSKLLIIYFTQELAKRLGNTNIMVNCIHPGVVATDVFRDYPKWFAKFMKMIITSPEEGAKPSIYLATSEDLKGVTGKYYSKLKQKEPVNVSTDLTMGEQIWTYTEDIISNL